MEDLVHIGALEGERVVLVRMLQRRLGGFAAAREAEAVRVTLHWNGERVTCCSAEEKVLFPSFIYFSPHCKLKMQYNEIIKLS